MSEMWKTSFEDRAEYNRNINGELFTCLAKLTPKALIRDRGSHFGSIIGLLNHILLTDIHWLDRFRPLDELAPPLNDGRLGSFSLAWEPLGEDLGELESARKILDMIFCDWFSHYPQENYGAEFEYRDSGGNLHKVLDYQAFDFVLMHQNYHRGQLSQILDDVGLPHSFADNGVFLKQ